MSLKEFVKELSGNRVEGELIKTIFYSLLTSFIVLTLFYFIKLQYLENFVSKYGLFLLLSALSFAIIIPTVRQVRAYKRFSCMSGMMIGMTVGMISGFLPGYFIGATNGMFVGSVYGMVIGILLGIWLGSSCGIMGFIEGMMAGFMGSLMGAMTSVMMLNDHLQLMSIVVFIIHGVIMFALNMMIYQETKESERQKEENQFITLLITVVLMASTTWLMVLGPRSALLN